MSNDCLACEHGLPLIDTRSWGHRIVNLSPQPFLCHGHVVPHAQLEAMGGVYHKVSLTGEQIETSWKIARTSGHSLVTRIRKVFGVGTKYPPNFSVEGQLCVPDRNMLIRIVSVSWLHQRRAEHKLGGPGYCSRRLQVRCYQCEMWTCPGHFYSQHLDSARCQKAKNKGTLE
jgi:hypothetical protein